MSSPNFHQANNSANGNSKTFKAVQNAHHAMTSSMTDSPFNCTNSGVESNAVATAAENLLSQFFRRSLSAHAHATSGQNETGLMVDTDFGKLAAAAAAVNFSTQSSQSATAEAAARAANELFLTRWHLAQNHQHQQQLHNGAAAHHFPSPSPVSLNRNESHAQHPNYSINGDRSFSDSNINNNNAFMPFSSPTSSSFLPNSSSSSNGISANKSRKISESREHIFNDLTI